MVVCACCQREIKKGWPAYALHGGKHVPLHRGCLRKKIGRNILDECEREAKARIEKWRQDWRLLIGEWLNRPYWEKIKGWVSCPVCSDNILGVDLYHPLLHSGVYEVGDRAFIGYTCPACGFFLPQLPDTSDKSFDEHWQAIKACVEEEEV